MDAHSYDSMAVSGSPICQLPADVGHPAVSGETVSEKLVDMGQPGSGGSAMSN
jgi:hypothetical protein